MNYSTDIVRKLYEMADPGYREFTSRLLPGTEGILGVRLPDLRRLAKKIARQDYRAFLEAARGDTMEERMLQGMVIGYVKADIEEVLAYTERFIPLIDNWSVCDSFCIGLKIAKTNRQRVWEFLMPYIHSPREYEARFGAVMLLDYFADEAYVVQALTCLEEMVCQEYYAKMGAAWAVSIFYVNAKDTVMRYLADSRLNDWVYNKALQKITESLCVSPEEKEQIRRMKR